MATTTRSVRDVCEAARQAARLLARESSARKDAALLAVADALEERTPAILEANASDLEAGREAGLEEALIDRLALDEARVRAIADGVRAVVALPDPVGEVIEGRRLESGLDVIKRRVPLGVIAVVYEARPNVTADAAALCLKSGNAVVLRGSGTAEHSNAALCSVIVDGLVGAGLPEAAVSLLGGGREGLAELATQDGLVDLLIPRGGEGLKRTLEDVATVPVMYAASGNCHVYVDAGADLDMAEAIAVNAKIQRPGVCNSAETLLVHEAVADELLPRVLRSLREAGVELVGDERVRGVDSAVEMATEEDWGTEYLALRLAVGVVGSTEEAIEHVNRYGSGHSEAIVTHSLEAAEAFERGVDAACVYVNASTRFTDGFEFGMGAEIGNSTQKLHARGPIGLRELTTYTYLVRGQGQVRS